MTTEYLIIEPWLRDALQARALQAAFDLGFIDVLAASESVCETRLVRDERCDAAGLHFLLEILSGAGAVNIGTSGVQLTEEFRAVLRFRDLLQTKLSFAELVAPDFFARLPQLLNSTDQFMATSQLFELFDYSRCQEITPQNCLQASRWMQLTTMLTRYEAPVCCDQFDFSCSRNMLDAGGNSGEFAVQVCRRNSKLMATVADLPVVCHVGARHVAQFPESGRIQFQPLHFLLEDFPVGHDLITFKSVLHDWPVQEVELLLAKAWSALPSGGRILIFERLEWDPSRTPFSYGLLPVLLFFRSYRSPDVYLELLRRLRFQHFTVQTVDLDMRFMIVSGSKP
ncbi:MAG: methyltransferase [Planctomycetaceae bacterium]